MLVRDLLSHSIIGVLRHLILLMDALHQIIWLHLVLLHLSLNISVLHRCLANSTRRWARHALRYHISVILINRVILVAIGVHIYFIKLMINFWFEKLLHHCPTVLSGQFLSQSEQQLVLVPLSLLGQLPKRILEVLHGVVPKLEQKFDHIFSMLLVILSVDVHG